MYLWVTLTLIILGLLFRWGSKKLLVLARALNEEQSKNEYRKQQLLKAIQNIEKSVVTKKENNQIQNTVDAVAILKQQQQDRQQQNRKLVQKLIDELDE